MPESSADYDFVVIGGGFYGCCLSLFLRSTKSRVLLVEANNMLMNRASRVNQARIHTGFHYPRSALTAVKSMILHRRFMKDFPDAVVSDFQMLYAVARNHSRVPAHRFFRMFRDLGAPVRHADPTQTALFEDRTIEGVFACDEAAFDYTVLRSLLSNRLDEAGVEVRMGTRVTSLTESPKGIVANLSDGQEVRARHAFNITYSQVNAILNLAGLPRAPLKHELTEIALIEPPQQLNGLGITVMDGPFFSCMPYPSLGLYSLTHVRYTPHESWIDDDECGQFHFHPTSPHPETRVRYMIQDARRFVPSLSDAKHVKSLFETKTVLLKNEHDDGRPILYRRSPIESRLVSILGAKIDNIYDLFDIVRNTTPELLAASDNLVMGRTE
jgi:glycine/D-amino acid oxidase-like deaminating enzyme